MTFRHRGNQSLAPQGERAICPFEVMVCHDRKIDRAAREFAQQTLMSAIHGLNIDVGESPMIFGQGRAKISPCRGRIDAKDEPANFSPAPSLEPGECDLGITDDAPRGIQEFPSCRSRTGPAVRSLKKDRSERELQGAEPATEGGLPDTQSLCSLS